MVSGKARTVRHQNSFQPVRRESDERSIGWLGFSKSGSIWGMALLSVFFLVSWGQAQSVAPTNIVNPYVVESSAAPTIGPTPLSFSEMVPSRETPQIRLVADTALQLEPTDAHVLTDSATKSDTPERIPTASADHFRKVDTRGQENLVRRLQNASEKMDLVVNTSRIVTLDKPIPQAQVNNPEVVRLTPLSPTQVQIAALKPGVTQVNLWGKDGKIYTIDVLVVGDARQLAAVLKANFPNCAIQVIPIADQSVYLTGSVGRQESVPHIKNIAQNFYPEVINNLSVAGVQQVLLHVKVMEVSRTKLRKMGFDWAQISGISRVWSHPSGLVNDLDISMQNGQWEVAWEGSPNETFSFAVINGTNAFMGALEAMRHNQLMKLLSEPTLVTVSGQPATFLVGGEIPYVVPQSLGTTSIEFKKYGTQLEFVPIVVGNGAIRIDVHPQISDLDYSVALENGTPGFKTREVQTSVEMKAGQTLAIAVCCKIEPIRPTGEFRS